MGRAQPGYAHSLSVTSPLEGGLARRPGNVAGDPTATRGAILKVVDAAEPPLRIFFGTTPLATATRDYESRLATWNEWQPVSTDACGAPQAPAASSAARR